MALPTRPLHRKTYTDYNGDWYSDYWSSITVTSELESSGSLPSAGVSTTGTDGISTPTVITETFLTTYTDGGSLIVSTVVSTYTTLAPITSGGQSTSSSSFTSDAASTATNTMSSSSSSPTSTQTPIAQVGAVEQAVCVGNGLDTQSIGLITSLIFSAAIGFIIWALFAILRPRIRSLYGLREWFVAPALRPPPLSNGLLAFLHPPVPLIPDFPSSDDIDKAREARCNPESGQQLADPAQLFASDEQLAQRTLWVTFLICLLWSLIALVIALPLYLVQTPCLPQSGYQVDYGGRYSTLNDLSILRLLRMLDDGSISTSTSKFTSTLFRRLIVDGKDAASNAYGRLIALCVIMIVLAIFPVLWKLWKEFTALAAYRRSWHESRCEGVEMGYLSCGTGNSWFLGNRGGAWGWRGWGEGRVKSFFRKAGLGGGTGLRNGPRPEAKNDHLSAPDRPYSRRLPSATSSEEKADAEINVMSVFTIGDTTRLAELIDERDIILDNLEIAETRYISSFQPITPSPSPSLRTVPLPPVPGAGSHHPIEGHNPSNPNDGFFASIAKRVSGHSRPSTASSDPIRDLKATISRPRALKGTYARRRHSNAPTLTGPTYPSVPDSTNDQTPTTYLAPSRYYKLRGMRGVTGGKMVDSNEDLEKEQDAGRNGATTPTLGQAIKQRLTGTKFLEVNRDSTVLGKLPIGSRMAVDEQGVLSPLKSPTHGPNYGDPSSGNEADDPLLYNNDYNADTQTARSATLDSGGYPFTEPPVPEDSELVMVDDARDVPHDQKANPSSGRARARPAKAYRVPPSQRETFPMRPVKKGSGGSTEQPPPHLRLQARQPFHRPISGLDHENLSAIYADIRHWRSALKTINAEIAEEQEKGFEDIAEGHGVKGWILVGKGLRFLEGVQLIEGRSKEDIRWDEIQSGGGIWSDIAFWVAICVIGILLGVGLLAAAGLALVTMPDVVHYLPFLGPVASHNNIQSGLATALAPAVAATIFIGLALFGIHRAARGSGAISITVLRIKAFKATFWVIVIIAGVWIVAASAILFGARAFDTGNGEAPTIANGSVATAVFLLFIVINIAIIVPGLLLLQPVSLWRQYRRKRQAYTPRQLFRAMYPKLYNPAYAMGCCILGIVFVVAFALLFPLIGPAVLLLVFLTLIAHRFLIGYVYGRTDSGQTGGLLQLWVIQRFATLLSLQPLLLGLILLAREKWILGGIMVGIAVVIVVLVEWYCTRKLREPGVDSLSPVTRDALAAYSKSARPPISSGTPSDPGAGSISERKGKSRRQDNASISSVLDMMSITLAVMPSSARTRPPVPLPTEHLDDLVATERAARTHPEAPPHLPPLSFVDHAEEMAGILYAPELTAPPPVIWLPNDSAGIARSEAYDLQHYHHLAATIDVRTGADVPTPRRSLEERKPKAR